MATVNPGGDYGNKELSPAFKNRFSEVWCPSLAWLGPGLASSEDLLAIVARSLAPGLQDLAERIVKLCTWLRESGAGLTVSVRDVLAWVTFINTVVEGGLAREVGVLQGAHLVWLDGLRVEGVSEVQARDSQAFVKRCREQLGAGEVEVEEGAYIEMRDLVSVGPFYIARSPGPGGQEQEFSFLAPTTCSNVAKMLRALQISKPLLLEGSPGIGKTSLVQALAARVGVTVVRINLSDQTDISDLFGSDLPVEGGAPGQFSWVSGPFLAAMERAIGSC